MRIQHLVNPPSNANRQSILFGFLKLKRQDRFELRQALRNNQVMICDIDTQIDFMEPMRFVRQPDGSVKRVGLPVPGAETIKKKLARLTALADYYRLPFIGTSDAHTLDDSEFLRFPDSDMHCVEGSEGFNRIPESTPSRKPYVIEVSPNINDVPGPRKLRNLLNTHWIQFKKNTFSAFQHRCGDTPEQERFVKNLKMAKLIKSLKALDVKDAFVSGVATEYCPRLFVEGLKQAGIRPFVVVDAIKGFNTDNLNDPINEGVYDDVTVITTREVEKLVRSVLGGKGRMA
jgi:nicotinamidase-related amidase